MQKTLNFCDQIHNTNPTLSDIEEKLLALDTSKNDGFLIYEEEGGSFVQAQGDKDIGFLIEYHNSANSLSLQTSDRLDFEIARSIFSNFMSGDVAWISKHQMHDL